MADVAPQTELQTTREASRARQARLVQVGLFAVGLIIIVASAVWFIRTAFSSQDETRLTHKITRGDLRVTVTEQGTLESSNNTEIKCKVRGFSTVTYVVESGTEVTGPPSGEDGKPILVWEDDVLCLSHFAPIYYLATKHIYPWAGDILVELDTKIIEEQYSLTKTNTFKAEATHAESDANVKTATIAIDAYEKGRFRSQLQELEGQLEEKKRNLRSARMNLERSEKLFTQGYITELEVEGNAFTVTRAELELKVVETEIKVLKNFTREMRMVELKGNLTANRSKLAADDAGLDMERKRRDRAREELDACLIRAPRSGMVIYPSAAAWKRTPDITEGANVRKDQVLLLMPDLDQMQVKVGIHESIIDRVSEGMKAIVTLPDRTLEAKVTKVAKVTRPAGWWTGNVVKYDTMIELPKDEGLKPGMSAEVEVIMAKHENVLMIPVAAVVETNEGNFCWVQMPNGSVRRLLKLGDSNDVFIEVKAGLNEGDEVILNPTAMIEDAKQEARKANEN